MTQTWTVIQFQLLPTYFAKRKLSNFISEEPQCIIIISADNDHSSLFIISDHPENTCQHTKIFKEKPPEIMTTQLHVTWSIGVYRWKTSNFQIGIQIHTQRQRHTERETHSYQDTQRHIERDRHTITHNHRQTETPRPTHRQRARVTHTARKTHTHTHTHTSTHTHSGLTSGEMLVVFEFR